MKISTKFSFYTVVNLGLDETITPCFAKTRDPDSLNNYVADKMVGPTPVRVKFGEG